ncbi:short-subunit dehydrogenase [Pedobacter cryoconitis]|uniref:Short-subunit dehydrogenase n=1 Tax=Pedobacter cryoconitis TaxID=188932 RepID=A0A7W8ZJL9_9SPHI|nr:SDR family oxidoreductase [Pedobacter cryoconitis]MBB5635075.1 short-subunit dehydrogenase [Pedobacter cryoconitis]MBB6271742.1 short-subunit dehydrogenase [Pedobacter cryoconitis]
MKKVILVTGASSGLGLAMANALSVKGYQVYGTGRDITQMKNVSFTPLEMDVINDVSVNASVRQIIAAEGQIDVLINNAGNGIAGPLYTVPVAIAKVQFEVNFFGLVRVCSAVLPWMIKEKKGLVINIGSLAGLFGLPYQGLYSASKFAVEGYSQSLRMELQNTGIKVSVINPGDFKTNFTSSRVKMPFILNNELLEKEFEAAIAIMEEDERIGSDPVNLAGLVCKIVAQSNPSYNYSAGKFEQTIVPALKTILPESVFSKLMNGHYGIK